MLQALPKINRTILLSLGEDGYYIVEIPSLPGCISQGKTREEAISNIQEAMELYIESLIQDGELIPEDRYEVIKI
jgi:predicted RNase H-like HicB family nuclease